MLLAGMHCDTNIQDDTNVLKEMSVQFVHADEHSKLQWCYVKNGWAITSTVAIFQ